MAKWRGKAATDEENTLGVHAPQSGRAYLLATLSRISQPFSRRSKNSDWQSITGENTYQYSHHSSGSAKRLKPVPLEDSQTGILKTVKYGAELSDPIHWHAGRAPQGDTGSVA